MELMEHQSSQVGATEAKNAVTSKNSRPLSVSEYLSEIRATTEADREYAIEMSGCLVELIKSINMSKSRAAQGDMEHSDFVLLIKLVKEGPRRASDLADQLCFDPSTVSRQVATMVKTGLIQRLSDPDDGRASILHPTDAGRARIAEHTKMRGMVLAPLVTGWSESEREIFLRLLGDVSSGITGNLEIVKEVVGRLSKSQGDRTPNSELPGTNVGIAHSNNVELNDNHEELQQPRRNS